MKFQSGAYTLYLVDTFSSFYTLMVICLFELMAIAWIYGNSINHRLCHQETLILSEICFF